MKSQKKRQLTAAEKRALGATPGLIVRRVGPEGRARLEQLAPESDGRRKDFASRLTRASDDTKRSEAEIDG
jgi:hypothetical protein